MCCLRNKRFEFLGNESDIAILNVVDPLGSVLFVFYLRHHSETANMQCARFPSELKEFNYFYFDNAKTFNQHISLAETFNIVQRVCLT